MTGRPRHHRTTCAAVVAAVAIVASGCADETRSVDIAVDDTVPSTVDSTDAPAGVGPRSPRSLAVGMTWQWQLQGDIDASHDVDVYDIDLFDAPAATIEQLRSDGRIVICYFSAGSHEEWRDDAAAFDDTDIGEPLDGWEGERWVDVRSDRVRSILRERFDLAASRGCDGVEADNVTAHRNDTGFDITAADQLDFNRFLAGAAHERGLLIGLKNDLEHIDELVDDFDFAVNEQCVEYDECDVYEPFVRAGKPVFVAEYADDIVADPDAACAVADRLGLSLIVLPYDLDGSFRTACAP